MLLHVLFCFYRSQQVSAYQDANAQLTERLAALERQANSVDPCIGGELVVL